jgi:hypothetical protein
MLLSIIIVNYNTSFYTLEALSSIFREKISADFEILVLDNGSQDDSFHQIKSSPLSNTIKLMRSAKNLGFAEGNNLLAQQATGEYLLLLNPDTVVLDKAVDRLLSFAQNYPKAGIWGGRTVYADGTLNPSSCWQRQTLGGLVCQATGLSSLFRKSYLFNPEGIGGWDRTGIREVDIVSGCFLLIRHSLWKSLNGLDPAFFMYGEEADLCLRSRQHGANPMVTSDATIIHHGGVSETVRTDQVVKLIRAKMLLIKKHFCSVEKPVARMLLTLWPLSRYIAHRMLAALGRKSSWDNAEVWAEIWKRRSEWVGKP